MYLSEHTPLHTFYGDLKYIYISKITILQHWLFIIKNTFVLNKVQKVVHIFTIHNYALYGRE